MDNQKVAKQLVKLAKDISEIHEWWNISKFKNDLKSDCRDFIMLTEGLIREIESDDLSFKTLRKCDKIISASKNLRLMVNMVAAYVEASRISIDSELRLRKMRDK